MSKREDQPWRQHCEDGRWHQDAWAVADQRLFALLSAELGTATTATVVRLVILVLRP